MRSVLTVEWHQLQISTVFSTQRIKKVFQIPRGETNFQYKTREWKKEKVFKKHENYSSSW